MQMYQDITINLLNGMKDHTWYLIKCMKQKNLKKKKEKDQF